MSDDLELRELPAFSAKMVLELAAKIHEPKDIIARYGMTPEQFKAISANPVFRKAYQEAKAFWESDANVRERIATKAAVLLEDSLLDLYQIVTSREMSAGARLTAFSQLANLAKVDGGEKSVAQQGAGGSITINIDMGAQVVSMEKQTPAIEGVYEEVPNES